MSTKARLGIDITATDRTAAAFASVERSMNGINRSFNQFKAGLAAIGFGNVFQNFVEGIVRVNAESGRGKVAADQLSASFRNFALAVGQGGLIEGIENFAAALNSSSREAKGLATVTGQALGGALTGLGNAIPSITAEFKDLGAAFGVAADKASTLAKMSSALDEFFRKYGPMSQNAQDGFFGVFDSSGKTSLPPGTLDKSLPKSSFKASMNDVNQMLGSIGDTGATFKKPLAKMVVPPGTIDDIYGAGKAVSALQANFQDAIGGAGKFSDSLFAIGDTIRSGVGSAISGLITGAMSVKDAFSSMAEGILSTLADLAAKLAINAGIKLLMSMLNYGVSPSQQGGDFFSQIFKSFAGGFATGGHLGAGKWGIAGEAGPEIIHGPAQITPMARTVATPTMVGNRAAPVNINVINNSSAHVSTKRGADGSIEMEIMEARLAERISRGGNLIDAAIQKGYGLRRSGR